MRGLILVHKLAVLPQVREILERYPLDELTFVFQLEGGRMSEAVLRSYVDPWLHGRTVSFFGFNFFKEMDRFHALARSTAWDLVAVMFVGGRPYYRLRYWVKPKTKFIAISDGTCDCTSVMDCCGRVRIHGTLDFFKSLAMAAEIACFAKAEEAYSLFHPLPCCFAEQTFPAKPFPVPEAKAELIGTMAPVSGPVDYVAQGYSIRFEDVVRKFALQNPVTTLKRPLDSTDFVTGEEVIDVLRPRRIVGYCCDALMYARKFSPETECIAITDPEANLKWGRFHNAVFQKQAVLLGGMKFVSFEDYLRM